MNLTRILTTTAFVVAAHAANAVVLAPGGVAFTTGTTAAADPTLAATVINDNLIDFRYNPSPATPLTDVGGNVQNRVASGLLTDDIFFAPRIRDTFNIDGATFSIIGFSVNGYAGIDLDVDFRTDGLGDKGIFSVSRSADGDLLTVRFEERLFVDAINPPGRQEESLFPSFRTNASGFSNTGTMTIFGEILPLAALDDSASVAANVFSFTVDGIAAPTPVPVPAPLLLMSAALGLLGWTGRRKA